MTTNNQSRLAAQSLGPVAWVQPNYLMALEKVGLVTAYVEKHRKADDVPIYTAPPQSAPVAVKPLEWNEYADERGDPDRWDAETLSGTYYGIAFLVDGFSVEYDYTAVAKGLHDLDAAKAAAQADYEQRIRSALVNAPMSASDGALRKALENSISCLRHVHDRLIDHKNTIDLRDQINAEICDIKRTIRALPTHGDEKAVTTLTAPGATTKSDGGEEWPASNPLSEVTHRPSDPKTSPELLALLERAKSHVMTPEDVYEQRRSFVRGMCPSNRDYTEWCADVDRIIPPLAGPSDTRPADVTVTPRVIDNDRDEIVVTLNGNELRGWSYSTEQERRVKMLCAREFVEGFHAGRQP